MSKTPRFKVSADIAKYQIECAINSENRFVDLSKLNTDPALDLIDIAEKHQHIIFSCQIDSINSDIQLCVRKPRSIEYQEWTFTKFGTVVIKKITRKAVFNLGYAGLASKPINMEHILTTGEPL